MGNKYTPNSRAGRFEKKRRGTKLLMWLAGAGSLLLVVFISVLIFGGDDQASNAKEPESNTSSEENVDSATDESDEEKTESESSKDDSSTEVELDDENNKEKSKDEQSEKNEEENGEKVTIEESSDENVVRVIKKDWETVQTEQEIEGQHRIKYDEGTQDWKELLTAVKTATGLSGDNMITWWVGRGDSPQSAYATVSDKDQTETMRVKVQWVEGKGYQPKQIEVLKENPHKNN